MLRRAVSGSGDAFAKRRATGMPIRASIAEDGLGVEASRRVEEPVKDSDTVRRIAAFDPADTESFCVPLTASELREIDGFSTAKKAEWIVRKHIERRFGAEVGIERDHEGADLRVSKNGSTERIEVKGTKSRDLAWAQLKVSSRASYAALSSGAASMYRVTDVDGSEPRVHVLKYGRDYELIPEPRWAARRVRGGASNSYPLRGRPYRYEEPYEAVATSQWDVLG